MAQNKHSIHKWCTDAWHSFSNLGVQHGVDSPISRRIILTNRVAAVVFVLGLGVAFYFLGANASTITFNWFAFLLGTIWIMPFLNALGHTWASRHILSSLMPLFIIAIVAHTRVSTPDEVHEASFYIPRFYLMAISFFPLLLFGPSERKRMYVSFGINMLILLLFNELLDFFGAGMGLLEPEVKDAFFISISSVICLVLIGSGFFFLNELNHNYEVRIGELLKDTEHKNMRISRAINYAQNIQKVVLPTQVAVHDLSERMFIIYRPLDVVSGDFYFLEERDGHILFAVIDCTGHGVPGAFVSMLAYSALQRAVGEHGAASPANILSKLNRLFHDDLSRSGNPDIRDGMDIAICSYNTTTCELKMAGANLTIYVVQQGRIAEYPCDRGYISQGDPERTFSEITLTLQEDDMVYLTSDGISDQFGGPQDKRLGRRGLASRLESIAPMPLTRQDKQIVAFFEEWKGNGRQIDDVCMIGFRA